MTFRPPVEPTESEPSLGEQLKALMKAFGDASVHPKPGQNIKVLEADAKLAAKICKEVEETITRQIKEGTIPRYRAFTREEVDWLHAVNTRVAPYRRVWDELYLKFREMDIQLNLEVVDRSETTNGYADVTAQFSPKSATRGGVKRTCI